MKTKIGIDLGTSTCEISYLKNGEAKIIKNLQEGESTIIPSAILFDNSSSFKVGNIARKKAILKPELVVENIKALMGTKALIEFGEEVYTPEFIYAILAKRLKEIAEFNINEKIEEAVVTVPARFNSLQRKATRDSLSIAGFKVIDIINEPTAAAIAYGIENIEKSENVLVYDLGGGTFDVSILEIENKSYKVLASEGNLNLGGNDINRILYETIVNLFENSVGIKIDGDNKRLTTELNIAIEEAKKSLSFESATSIVVPNIAIDTNGASMDLNLDLSREDFEYLIDEFVNSTLEIVDKTLACVKIDRDEIDKVILVGGSTRMPLIRKKVNDIFNGKVLNGVNPDELVAKGAILSTLNKNNENIAISEIVNNDIGVEILNEKFDRIVKKGTKLPIVVKKSYKTVEDNQEIAEIKVYEGEEVDIKSNKFISSFDIENIPKDAKGGQQIDLVFTCNLDGVLVAESKVISNLSQIRKDISLKGLTDKDINMLKTKIKRISVFDGKTMSSQEKEELINKENERRLLEKRRVENKKIEEERIQRERIENERREQERIDKERIERERIEQAKLEEKRKAEAARLETEEAKRQKEITKESEKALDLKLNISSNQVRNVIDTRNENFEVSEKNNVSENILKKEEVVAVNQNIDASDLLEEYDPSRDGEIYNDIATLMEYYKKVSPNLDAHTKEKAQELIGDLVGLVKKDKFKDARGKENEIIELIYRG
ncbi:MAG: Hsp70 family protein [Sarcina sp.]